jgi:hypothetical protein
MSTQTSWWVSMGRRRFAFGLVSSFLAGLLGVTVLASAAWSLEAGPTRLVYFVLPDWALIFCAHLISVAAAVVGLALLVPPFTKGISRIWLRRLIGVLVGVAVAAASVPWLLYFVGIGLNAASATYIRVTAESGESVIVEHSGFDRRDYAVYGQESFFLYERSGGWRTASDVFDPDSCTLAVKTSDLLLTCGADSVPVPPLGGEGAS